MLKEIGNMDPVTEPWPNAGVTRDPPHVTVPSVNETVEVTTDKCVLRAEPEPVEIR